MSPQKSRFPLSGVLRFTGGQKVLTYLGAYGAQSAKPVKLFYTAPWCRVLSGAWCCSQ